VPYTEQDGLLSSTSHIAIPDLTDEVEFCGSFQPNVDVDIPNTVQVDKPPLWFGFKIFNGGDGVTTGSSNALVYINNSTYPRISSSMNTYGLQNGDIAIWILTPFSPNSVDYSVPAVLENSWYDSIGGVWRYEYSYPPAPDYYNSVTVAEMESIRYSIYMNGAFGPALSLSQNESGEYLMINGPWTFVLYPYKVYDTVGLDWPDNAVFGDPKPYQYRLAAIKLDFDVYHDGQYVRYIDATSFELSQYPIVNYVSTDVIYANNIDTYASILATTDYIDTSSGTKYMHSYVYETEETLEFIKITYMDRGSYVNGNYTVDGLNITYIQSWSFEKIFAEWMKVTDIMVSLIKERFVQKGVQYIPAASISTTYSITFPQSFDSVPTLEFADNNAFDATVTSTGFTVVISAHPELFYLTWIAWVE
jgi:hypothetical protein